MTTYEACDAAREGASVVCSSMLHRPLPADFGGVYLLSAFTPPAFGRRREGGITKFWFPLSDAIGGVGRYSEIFGTFHM